MESLRGDRERPLPPLLRPPLRRPPLRRPPLPLLRVPHERPLRPDEGEDEDEDRELAERAREDCPLLPLLLPLLLPEEEDNLDPGDRGWAERVGKKSKEPGIVVSANLLFVSFFLCQGCVRPPEFSLSRPRAARSAATPLGRAAVRFLSFFFFATNERTNGAGALLLLSTGRRSRRFVWTDDDTMAAKHDDGDRDGPEEEGWRPPHHRRDPLLDGTGVGLVRASLPVVARHGRRVRYVGIDIECTGDDVLRHKIIAAGLAWVDLLPDDDALACAGAKLWTMDVPEDPESAFEPRCWEEFWSKQPEALRGIREHRAAALAAGGLPDDAAVWRDLRRTLDAVCLEAARDGAKGLPRLRQPGLRRGARQHRAEPRGGRVLLPELAPLPVQDARRPGEALVLERPLHRHPPAPQQARAPLPRLPCARHPLRARSPAPERRDGHRLEVRVRRRGARPGVNGERVQKNENSAFLRCLFLPPVAKALGKRARMPEKKEKGGKSGLAAVYVAPGADLESANGDGRPLTPAKLAESLRKRGFRLQRKPSRNTRIAVVAGEGKGGRGRRRRRPEGVPESARVVTWAEFAARELRGNGEAGVPRREGGSKKGKEGRWGRSGSRSGSRMSRRGGSIATKLRPALWERCKEESVAKLGGKFSARAMQHAVSCYKSKCGSRCYAGGKRRSASNSLASWTREDWTTETGAKSEGKRRYLPREVWKRLSPEERRRTNEAKRRGKSQWVSQPDDVKRKAARLRKALHPRRRRSSSPPSPSSSKKSK